MGDANYIECFNDDCKHWSNGKCRYYKTGKCVEIGHTRGIPTCNSFEPEEKLKEKENEQ